MFLTIRKEDYKMEVSPSRSADAGDGRSAVRSGGADGEGREGRRASRLAEQIECREGN